MHSNNQEQILADICGNRQDLLELGLSYCQKVSEKPHLDSEQLKELNDAVEGIFALEGMPLSESEKELIEKLDQLNWNDEQVIEFLQMYGGADNEA